MSVSVNLASMQLVLLETKGNLLNSSNAKGVFCKEKGGVLFIYPEKLEQDIVLGALLLDAIKRLIKNDRAKMKYDDLNREVKNIADKVARTVVRTLDELEKAKVSSDDKAITEQYCKIMKNQNPDFPLTVESSFDDAYKYLYVSNHNTSPAVIKKPNGVNVIKI